MSVLKRIGTVGAVASLALAGMMAMPHQAKAWWHGGWGVGVVLPPVVIAPPVYAPPPPVVYAPPPVAYAPAPYYAPRRVWIPPHWRGGYWVPGHWS
ncbi:MAG TPA: hypothetical protein VHB27_20430 [Rhodopila sp.]|uniref:hypothetical protein n=1 Tax=Rhodopila sp. TaxID=2480087 RepID=UPI002B70C87A|nr:hypothetical protein [Rhodopila sp.]HVY17597.1 hypothetical protein [Rhodopila sp.]